MHTLSSVITCCLIHQCYHNADTSLWDEPCSDQSLEQISQYIDEWKMIAPMLKLTPEDMKEIIGNPSFPVSSQKVRMLKRWRQKQRSMMMATYQKLADTLMEYGKQDLVKKITGLVVNAAKPITTSAGECLDNHALACNQRHMHGSCLYLYVFLYSSNSSIMKC